MSKTQRGSNNTSCSKTSVKAWVNTELAINITFGGLNQCHNVDSATPEPSAAAIGGRQHSSWKLHHHLQCQWTGLIRNAIERPCWLLSGPLYSCSPCSQRVDLMALKKKPKKATLLIVAIALSLVTLLFESFWIRRSSRWAQSHSAKAKRFGMLPTTPVENTSGNHQRTMPDLSILWFGCFFQQTDQ